MYNKNICRSMYTYIFILYVFVSTNLLIYKSLMFEN